MAVNRPNIGRTELLWRSGNADGYPPCPESYELIVQGILGLKRAGVYHNAALRVAEIDAERQFEAKELE